MLHRPYIIPSRIVFCQIFLSHPITVINRPRPYLTQSEKDSKSSRMSMFYSYFSRSSPERNNFVILTIISHKYLKIKYLYTGGLYVMFVCLFVFKQTLINKA